jgi:hypothetical protein
MTLVVDGMPSSGGPRCFGWRGARDFASLASVVGACVLASLVTSVNGSGSAAASPASPVALYQN